MRGVTAKIGVALNSEIFLSTARSLIRLTILDTSWTGGLMVFGEKRWAADHPRHEGSQATDQQEMLLGPKDQAQTCGVAPLQSA